MDIIGKKGETALMRTLVLNAGYEPIKIVTWQRAVVLVMNEKAEMISSYGSKIRSVTRSFARPKVIRLKRYISVLRNISQSVPYSRINVFKRDEFFCQYCNDYLNSKTATLDHIVPQSRGGKNTWENTVCSCEPCNRQKGDRTPPEAGMKLRKTPKKPNPVKYILSQLGDFSLEDIWQS